MEDALPFETTEQLENWLESNHASQSELWVRIYKKDSGQASVSWNDCVVAALSWGWIDGLKKSLDEHCYLQRLTPRRPKSSWSKKNCDHAERLIVEGRMQPPGLAQVEAAKQDGRWDRAYAGSSEMVIPEDFLQQLSLVPKAKQFFDTLHRQNRFAIYYRLQTASSEQTRKKRIGDIIAKLEREVAFH
jgi:uncharacterized protein YdeI (YjbR/CyaY-like superfamily)